MLTVLLLAGLIAACGDAEGSKDEPQPSAAFEDVVKDLERAALMDRTYDAIQHAEELDATERRVLGAFCETAWQIDVNDEADLLKKHAYVRNRIASRAEFKLGILYSKGHADEKARVDATVARLAKIVGLESFDAALTRRYKRACYR